MGDTISKWHEMQEELPKPQPREHVKYVFVLDYADGKVYRYDISSLCNEGNKWNPESESCEAFLIGAGHNLSNIEWMTTTNFNGNVETGN